MQDNEENNNKFEMSALPKILEQSNSVTLTTVDEDNEGFSLEKLSTNLTLSSERSKSLYNLYEDNNVLKKKSDSLSEELDKEKTINQLQSEFVSMVSHEFKTPLAIIKASMDVLKRVGLQNEDIFNNQIEKVDKAIVRVNKLVESTLNLSRLESGKLEFKPVMFCLEDLLVEVVDRHRDLNEKAVFNIDVNTDKRLFNGDRDLIDQTFTNLVSNAIKYSREAPQIIVKCHIVNQSFVVSVQDSGIGMSEEDLKKLFSKFFRSQNTTGIAGTGIGLYLVKQFTELHHGDIAVESQEGVGTKFTLTLPIT